MSQNYPWLRDQSRYREVIEWLAGRWDLNVLDAWSRGRFGLDELKTWIADKYPIDDVVRWTYHESDTTADLTKTVIDAYRPGIEAHKGTIAFIGIDEAGFTHIAFDGACGACTQRELATTESLKEDLAKYVPGFKGLINDGPTRASLGNFAEQDYGSVVQIRPIGRDRIAPTQPPSA